MLISIDPKMSNIQSQISNIQSALQAAYPADEANALAWWIAEELTGLSRTELQFGCKGTNFSSHMQEIETIIDRLLHFEPIQYIFGHTLWNGLDLKVTPSTLIPRPETAELVERINLKSEILNLKSPIHVLDVGTGSGCIAIALKKAHPEWSVTGIDISPEAIEVARENARRNNVDVHFEVADIFSDQMTKYLNKWYMVNDPYGKADRMNEVNKEMVNDQMVNIVDAFNDTYGPEWFADSTYAGIVPGTYACEDHFTCAYIGAQWDYRRASQWINDDNCGWGACYRDHAGQLTMGNTRDWSVQHGRILRQMGISYVSCTAGMMGEVSSQNSEFSLIDYVCGRQRNPLTDANRQWLGEYLAQGGKLLLSTDHFSAIDVQWAKRHLHASYYAAKATRSGRIVRPNHRPYRLLMEPNETQLFTCTPEALRPEDANAARYASYEDMRCPAAVSSPNTLVYGFPLESVIDFDKIYRQSIEFLLK